jgi:hypothetical protein
MTPDASSDFNTRSPEVRRMCGDFVGFCVRFPHKTRDCFGDGMRLVIKDNADDVSEWVANYVVARINGYNPTADRPFVLGLPTGSSPLAAYKKASAASFFYVWFDPQLTSRLRLQLWRPPLLLPLVFCLVLPSLCAA